MRDLKNEELAAVSGGYSPTTVTHTRGPDGGYTGTTVTGTRGGGTSFTDVFGYQDLAYQLEQSGFTGNLNLGVEFDAEEFLINFIEESESIRTAAMVAVVEGRDDNSDTISPEQLAEIQEIMDLGEDIYCAYSGHEAFCQIGRDLFDR